VASVPVSFGKKTVVLVSKTITALNEVIIHLNTLGAIASALVKGKKLS